MATATQVVFWLKELIGRLEPRHDAFRYLYSVRTAEHRGKRSPRLPGSGWRGLAPWAKSLQRGFVALLLKALD